VTDGAKLHRSEECVLLAALMQVSYSQDFFREQEYRKISFASMEDAIGFLEGYYRRSDANDLLACYGHADISANDRFKGGFRKSAARYSRPTV
jgi:hypothetical protein